MWNLNELVRKEFYCWFVWEVVAEIISAWYGAKWLCKRFDFFSDFYSLSFFSVFHQVDQTRQKEELSSLLYAAANAFRTEGSPH